MSKLVEAFAENAAKKLVPSGSHPTWALIASVISLAGHHFGLSIEQVAASELGIALLGPELSRFVRSVSLRAQSQERITPSR